MANKENTAPHVYQAIAAITGAIGKIGISKDSKNTHQGYKFRGIDDVYNVVNSLLAEHKLCILPKVLSRSITERTNKKGSVLFYVVVEVEFDFVSAIDGTKHAICIHGEAMDSGDKATNKAMSAAYKYAAMQTFCIPTEGDNDADSQTHEIAPSKATSRDEYEQIVETIRGAETVDELREFWGGIPWADVPKDWVGEIEREKTERVAELGRSTQADGPSAEDSISSQFPGDMSNPNDSGVT